MLKLDLTKKSFSFLKKLSSKQFKQIVEKLFSLMKNPYPNDVRKLKGYEYYRVDIGEYRIIYKVEKEILKVAYIGKRNDDEIYKKITRGEK